MLMQQFNSSTGRPIKRPHLWLLTIPFIWQVALVPVVNDIAATPFGMPFPMVWQILGIIVSTLVIATVFHLDNKAGLDKEEAEFIEATSNRDVKK